MKPIWIFLIIFIAGCAIVKIILVLRTPKEALDPCGAKTVNTSSAEYKAAYDKLSPMGQISMPMPGSNQTVQLCTK